MVAAPFLEIQRKMLPRHLRLKGAKTKALIFTSSHMGFSSPIQPSTVFLSWSPVLSSFASESPIKLLSRC